MEVLDLPGLSLSMKFIKNSELNGVTYYHFMVQWSGPMAFEFELLDRFSRMLKFKRNLQRQTQNYYKIPSFPNKCMFNLFTKKSILNRQKKLQKFFDQLLQSKVPEVVQAVQGYVMDLIESRNKAELDVNTVDCSEISCFGDENKTNSFIDMGNNNIKGSMISTVNQEDTLPSSNKGINSVGIFSGMSSQLSPKFSNFAGNLKNLDLDDVTKQHNQYDVQEWYTEPEILSSLAIKQRIAKEGDLIVSDTSRSMMNLNYQLLDDESPELSKSRSIKQSLIHACLTLQHKVQGPAVLLNQLPKGSNENFSRLEESDSDIEEDEFDLGDTLEMIEK